MPQPTKPQLAIYAAFAIAVLLIGARFLRSHDDASGGGGTTSGLVAGESGGDGSDGAGGSGRAGGLDAGGSGEAGASGADASGSLDGGAGADGGSTGSDAGTSGFGEGAGESAAVAGEDGAGGAAEIVVDVKGAVRHAGVYRLAPGSRALDAVRRAGGMTHAADRLGVNLAAPVTDGGEVVVPRRGAPGMSATRGTVAPPSSSAAGAGESDAAAAPDVPLSIDINTASEQELEQLDGVGPATAAKILEYRQLHGGFKSIDELDEVSGIGEAKLAAIRAQLGR
jgi:competence protein ComEA